jgi:histidinol dehydrogenase
MNDQPMPLLPLIETTQTDAATALKTRREGLLLDRLILDDSAEARTVREIIQKVREGGDEAVAEITERVDGVRVPPDRIRVPQEAIRQARERLPASLRQAIQHGIESVRRFQTTLLAACPPPLSENGRTLSVRHRPLSRIAVCVPGAAAPLPSSAIHCAVPAQVAGVRDIVLVAPPRHEGDVHPVILGVADELGITEVYRMGGAQAIAALAIGTQRVGRVEKIVGPGSVYVQLAKRFLFGVVDIDMFAGPSEVVIIADETAKAACVAADMLAQAEHDPGCSILLTPYPRLAQDVLSELNRQLLQLTRREATQRSLEQFSAIVVTQDLEEAARLANEIAPEHLQIETRSPERWADQVDCAGTIFLGHHTPEAAGDYVAGPSHVLPTGGTARFWSGLASTSFIRRTSLVEYTPGGLAHDASSIELLALAEGLDAHARSVSIRTRPEPH